MVVDERPTNILEPELQQELMKHEGRWVAMTRTELIAVGDDPNEVANEAASLGITDPIVYFVPRDNHTSMFF